METCPICLATFTTVTNTFVVTHDTTHPSHTFCWTCITQWVRHSGSTLCPFCRQWSGDLEQLLQSERVGGRMDGRLIEYPGVALIGGCDEPTCGGEFAHYRSSSCGHQYCYDCYLDFFHPGPPPRVLSSFPGVLINHLDI